MPVLVTGIYVATSLNTSERASRLDVDGRDKRGHDGKGADGLSGNDGVGAVENPRPALSLMPVLVTCIHVGPSLNTSNHTPRLDGNGRDKRGHDGEGDRRFIHRRRDDMAQDFTEI